MNPNESIIINPNQAEFPMVISEASMEGDKQRRFVGIITDGPLEGKIEVPSVRNGNYTLVVEDVLEEKPARGDWSGEKWAGTNPTFNGCVCVVKIKQPDEAVKK